ncbi:hypothetical protein PR048_002426 [Dryococelus australis]|uniref:Reverse transcriptase n=1 Tax=Dryococelus australis TaxID=614101 RepID=A0ABQ9IK41_9NEOP|nr:hypothetical protein PR048_002426 [Dryococelus australis]
MVKLTLPAVLPTLHITSMTAGYFSRNWKYTLVRPFPKITSPKTAADYRPISILPELLKPLEKLVHTEVLKYIAENNLLDPLYGFKIGFRKRTDIKSIKNQVHIDRFSVATAKASPMPDISLDDVKINLS